MIVGAILAGGRSRRMGGGDKFLLALDGERLVDRVVRRLTGQVDRLVVTVNGNAAAVVDLGLPLVEDVPEFAGQGPLSGVLAALRWADAAAGRDALVLTAPADVPFLPLDLAARLAAASEEQGADIAVASSGGQLQYPVALWRAAVADDMEGWLRREGRSAVRGYMASRPVAVAEFAGPYDAFFNVNLPEDLAEARAIARRFRP